ncbi:transketolase [Candidatus Collierbacteria bacterium]|nr:transketolase [Candidatus Collierbacteria bacterium]
MPSDFFRLTEKASLLRAEVVKTLTNAGTGHSAGPLGSADFWTVLYLGNLINYRVDEPWWEERDRVVLSAGHYCPILYAVLAEAGFFPKTELATLRQLGSRLQGHPVVKMLPGIETSSGPLGQGISQAVGMALAAKMDNKKWRVICFMGDGEQDEGQVWEAYLCAAKYGLSNLTVVIDRNNIQIDGHTENVMPLGSLAAKLSAFNFNVIEVDGHSMTDIAEAMGRAKVTFEKPTAIILTTTPGKGVSFMENDPSWHGKVPSPAEEILALAELRRQ